MENWSCSICDSVTHETQDCNVQHEYIYTYNMNMYNDVHRISIVFIHVRYIVIHVYMCTHC